MCTHCENAACKPPLLSNSSLTMLEHLSVLDNKLEEVPAKLGHLTRLSEINLNFNKLSWLPRQLYQCKELTKLYMQPETT